MSEESNKSKAASAQHEVIGVGSISAKGSTLHPEARWFGERRLGLFVHWGLSSVDGTVDISWGMIKDKPWGGTSIPPSQYWSLANGFQPGRYDPEPWLETVARAGFDYAVFTTKHHDGYLMWPAAQTALGTATHLEGRDLVEPFVKACRNTGLKVGLYYSPPDWWFCREHLLFDYPGLKASSQHPGEPAQGLGINHERKQLLPPEPEFDAAYRAYIRSHIFELLERWGRIDLLWFDGRGVSESAPPIMELDEIREKQPWIVINPRLTGKGDYVTFECRDAGAPPAGWWEKCTVWNNGGWGYMNEESYRSADEVYRDYQRTHDAGGNFMINIAPLPDGTIPEIFFRELEAFRVMTRAAKESTDGFQTYA